MGGVAHLLHVLPQCEAWLQGAWALCRKAAWGREDGIGQRSTLCRMYSPTAPLDQGIREGHLATPPALCLQAYVLRVVDAGIMVCGQGVIVQHLCTESPILGLEGWEGLLHKVSSWATVHAWLTMVT